jgi:hypothetical protein
MTMNSPLISLHVCRSDFHPPQSIPQSRTLWMGSAAQKALPRPFLRSACPGLAAYFQSWLKWRRGVGVVHDKFGVKFKNLFPIKTTDTPFLDCKNCLLQTHSDVQKWSLFCHLDQGLHIWANFVTFFSLHASSNLHVLILISFLFFILEYCSYQPFQEESDDDLMYLKESLDNAYCPCRGKKEKYLYYIDRNNRGKETLWKTQT